MNDDMLTQLEGVRSELRGLNERLESGLKGVGERLDGLDSGSKSVNERVRSIALEQSRLRGDMESVKENMVTRGEFKASVDRILGGMDAQTKLMEEFRHRWAVQSGTLSDHRAVLDDHERRITALEPRPE